MSPGVAHERSVGRKKHATIRHALAHLTDIFIFTKINEFQNLQCLRTSINQAQIRTHLQRDAAQQFHLLLNQIMNSSYFYLIPEYLFCFIPSLKTLTMINLKSDAQRSS